MERLHALASIALVLAVVLACKSKRSEEVTTASSAPAVAIASASAVASESAAAPPAAASASAAVPAASAAVKLENCGQRYAAPARLDGKCADYCGGDYKCGPDETCTATSWPTKAGVRNTKVCAPKGVAVRAPVSGAAWDADGPAQDTSAVAATSAAAPGDKNGEVAKSGGTCPSGWVLAEDACHRPCAKDSECNPPKSFCKKWQGKKLCAFTGSLVVPND